MKFPKIAAQSAPLVEFFEEGLSSLGAVCQRAWHDRLEVLAEGDAARLWQPDGRLHAAEIGFPDAASPGPRNATAEVFPGCPLTFHLVEALWRKNVGFFRACLSGAENVRPPDAAVAEKLWQAQFRASPGWHAAPMQRAWHISVVAPVRCEVQAIDQSWSFHRLAFAVASGERDRALESALDHFGPAEMSAGAPSWPESDLAALSRWITLALPDELGPELAEIRARQERYLRRELARVDDYFEHYEQELNARLARQHREQTIARARERIEATRAEHQRRRADQIERHAIRVIPHVDALLLIAEPAFSTRVMWRTGREEASVPALFLPRLRRWFADIS